MHGKPRILSLSPTRLKNSIKGEHSCKILYVKRICLQFLFSSVHNMYVKIEYTQNFNSHYLLNTGANIYKFYVVFFKISV